MITTITIALTGDDPDELRNLARSAVDGIREDSYDIDTDTYGVDIEITETTTGEPS